MLDCRYAGGILLHKIDTPALPRIGELLRNHLRMLDAPAMFVDNEVQEVLRYLMKSSIVVLSIKKAAPCL